VKTAFVRNTSLDDFPPESSAQNKPEIGANMVLRFLSRLPRSACNARCTGIWRPPDPTGSVQVRSDVGFRLGRRVCCGLAHTTTAPEITAMYNANPRSVLPCRSADPPTIRTAPGSARRTSRGIEPGFLRLSFFRRIAKRYSGDEPPPDARPGRGSLRRPEADWGGQSWCARPGSASITYSAAHQ